jgi:hypothetical protein
MLRKILPNFPDEYGTSNTTKLLRAPPEITSTTRDKRLPPVKSRADTNRAARTMDSQAVQIPTSTVVSPLADEGSDAASSLESSPELRPRWQQPERSETSSQPLEPSQSPPTSEEPESATISLEERLSPRKKTSAATLVAADATETSAISTRLRGARQSTRIAETSTAAPLASSLAAPETLEVPQQPKPRRSGRIVEKSIAARLTSFLAAPETSGVPQQPKPRRSGRIAKKSTAAPLPKPRRSGRIEKKSTATPLTFFLAAPETSEVPQQSNLRRSGRIAKKYTPARGVFPRHCNPRKHPNLQQRLLEQ